MKRSLHGLAALAALAAVACDHAPSWPPSPAELRAGEEVCAECRMFVSDARFAIQLHSPSGGLEWFDDLGCLLEKHPQGVEPLGVFVADLAGSTWVRGDRGFAVQSPEIDSPMGSGWFVHASAEQAQRAAQAEGARQVSLSEFLRRGASAEAGVYQPAPGMQAPGEDNR